MKLRYACSIHDLSLIHIWGERAEERHEARDDDGEPAVFGKEMVELAHAFRRERFHFAGIDDAHAEEPVSYTHLNSRMQAPSVPWAD